MLTAPRRARGVRPTVLATILAVLATPLALGFAAPASASVSAISTFPYTQDWSGLTGTSTWADFPGVEGYTPARDRCGQPAQQHRRRHPDRRGHPDLEPASVGHSVPNAVTTGGIWPSPSAAASKTVALSATGSITTPLLAFHLDTTGSRLDIAYDVQDLDSSADDQPQASPCSTASAPRAPTPTSRRPTSPTRPGQQHHGDLDPRSAALPSAVEARPTSSSASSPRQRHGQQRAHRHRQHLDHRRRAAPLAARPGRQDRLHQQAARQFTLAGNGGTEPYTWGATGHAHRRDRQSAVSSLRHADPTGTYPVHCHRADAGTARATASTQSRPRGRRPTPATSRSTGPTMTSSPWRRPAAPRRSRGARPACRPAYRQPPASCPARPPRRRPHRHGHRDRRRIRTAWSTFDHHVGAVPLLDHCRDPGHRCRLTVRRLATARESSLRRRHGQLRHDRRPDRHGFYLRPADARHPGASDAIFVYTGAAPPRRSATRSGHRQRDGVLRPDRAHRHHGDDMVPVLPTPAGGRRGHRRSRHRLREQGDDCPTAPRSTAVREEHEGEPSCRPRLHRHRLLRRQPLGPLGPRLRHSARSGSRPTAPSRSTSPSSGHPGRRRAAWPAREPTTTRTGSPSTTARRVDQRQRQHGTGLPWLTDQLRVRVGAPVTSPSRSIFDYRFGMWRLQPADAALQPGTDGSDQGRVRAEPRRRSATTCSAPMATSRSPPSTCSTTSPTPARTGSTCARRRPAAPTARCSYYTDRAGNRVTPTPCTWKDPRTNPPSTLPAIGPRGAATEVSLLRQQGKEVAAINTMAADVMSLEEVENPVKIGYADRDAAAQAPRRRAQRRLGRQAPRRRMTRLGAAGPSSPSPRPEAQPTIAEQDAIRNAFIYNPRVVETVGRSQILVNSPAVPQRP